MGRRFAPTGHAARLGWLIVLAAAAMIGAGSSRAQGIRQGDLDGDGVATVRDMARIVGQINETVFLDDAERALADLTGDGAISQADVDELILEILGTREPEDLPLATVRFSSPEDGEGNVAVTRETVVHFTMPLALDTVIDGTTFSARFGERRLLTRVELAGDRRKATLFYLEPLPSNARIDVTLIDNGLADLLGRPVDLDGDGGPGGDFRMFFESLSITANGGTAVVGRVFASEPGLGQMGNPVDVPLAGVTITVDGAEETMRAVTDAQGNFTLSPCPAGEFFVKIDGRTSPQSAYPGGDYYPVVGKQWFADPGRTDNPAGGTGTVYLPCICAGSLQTVSASEESPVGFPAQVLERYPELEGTVVAVPANALFANDGTRGGMVGIAPVAPQRLPEPLPPGLDFPLVITIQTDGGTNFDQPVPVSFPNLPDPATGVPLPPGAKSALWSFDHDTGIWEVAGSMTVSPDGRLVTTDPGVGVRQPGWHGPAPGTQVTGSGPVCPPPETPVNCPEVSTWDYLNLAYTVLKEMASCAADLAGVSTAVKCAMTLATTTIDLLASASKFQEQLNKGVVSLAGAKAFLGQAKAIKARLLADGACIEDISPVNRAQQVFNCFGNLLSISDALCNFGVPQPGDPPPPKGCEPADSASPVCSAVGKLKFLHDKAKSILNVLQKYENEFKLGLLCFTLDTLEDVVTNLQLESPPLQALPGGGAAAVEGEDDRMLTPDEVAMVLGALADLETEADLFVGAGAQYPGVLDWLTASNSLVDQELQRVSSEIGRRGQPGEGIAFWAIDIGGTTLRGTVRPGGRINAILGPEQPYLLRVYNPTMNLYSEAPGRTPRNGSRSVLTATILDADGPPLVDSDGDGLADVGETVIGTFPANPDSDGDGLTDGAEISQGTNPLDNVPTGTGIIASAPVTGSAEDICAVNDIAVTANGSAGISVFNVFSGLNPTRIAELRTGGSAIATACFGDLVGVAAYTAGLEIVDIADPADVRIARRVRLSDPAVAVTTAGPTAFVGTTTGTVVAVDLPTGAVLESIHLPYGAVQDLGVAGETLYVLQVGKLTAVPLGARDLVPSATVDAPGGTGAGRRRLRLFAGTDVLYTTWRQGFNIFDIAGDPEVPALVETVSTAQQGWKQIVSNGSGLGIGAVSPNSTNDGPHHVNLYALGPDGRGSDFIATIPTPGLAAAVSVYAGLAYVADSRAGLQVVNYRDFDTAGQPPTIELDSNAGLDAGVVEEGSLVRLTARVADDVQVRHVEFFIDGQRVLLDGNFPFEHRFIAPLIADGATEIVVQARAVDTGGNATQTPGITLTLSPDATPPEVIAHVPDDGAFVISAAEVAVEFSEAIDLDSLAAGGMALETPGPDGDFDTGDDTVVAGGGLSFRDESFTAFLAFPAPLPPGLYRVRVREPASDLAGNAVLAPSTAGFRILSDFDGDGDGVPDDWEPLLGLTPGEQDSDGDGTADGDEDFDNDGVPNGLEALVLQTAPNRVDSDGDGISDGNEDPDSDGLTNAEEASLGTNLLAIDSDGDRLDDFSESRFGSDPLDPSSGTDSVVSSARAAYMNAVDAEIEASSLPVSASSQPAAFMNAVEAEPPPQWLGVAASSGTASYQNAVMDSLPASLPVGAASDVVTYENQSPAPPAEPAAPSP